MRQRCLGCMAEYESTYEVCPYCGYEAGAPAESPLHMAPGTLLAGRYLIGRVLGYGGFGVTYLGWDQVLGQAVAVKEYLPSEFATRMAGQSRVTVFQGNKAQQFADGLGKFVDEAKRLVKFQDEPGIVRVFDSFEANQTAYLVMEYLEGETLAACLEREGKLPPERAVALLEPVIRSLEAVHQAGILHRDIAPTIFSSPGTAGSNSSTSAPPATPPRPTAGVSPSSSSPATPPRSSTAAGAIRAPGPTCTPWPPYSTG